MTLFIILTVIQAFVAAGLVLLVLMQRSEGGGLGLGGGGSPGGVLSARGSADFLSRTTKWFAVVFVGLSILLAAVAVDAGGGQREYDDTLDRSTSDQAPVQDLLAPSAPAGEGAAAPAEAPATAPADTVTE